jgi:hypothetical protein
MPDIQPVLLPSKTMDYAMTDTANAFGSFLRRYTDFQAAIGINDPNRTCIAVVIPRAAALAMFPNPAEEDWPLREFKTWAKSVGLQPDWLGVSAGFQKIKSGLRDNEVWFLHASHLRGFLLHPQIYLRLLREQRPPEI